MKDKRIIALALVLAALLPGRAQTSGTNSPYSRYGWGNLTDESQSFNKGMSGLALGMRAPYIVNRQNPAAYSAIDSLAFVFDIAATLSTAHMSVGNRSVNPQNTTFDHVTAAFRLRRGLGVALGMRPITNIGYNFTTSQRMEDVDGYGETTASYSYLGEGGTRQVFFGMGWAPFRVLSVGANVGYLWGDYSHQSVVSFSNSEMQSLARAYLGNINTWTLDVGAQYVQRLSRKDVLTVGLTTGIGHKINQKANFINQKKNSSSVIGADTMSVRNAYELPMSLGAGFTFDHNHKWLAGVDVSYQLWKDCRYPMLVTENGIDRYRVGKNVFSDRLNVVAGFQYVPNVDGFRWRNHINYRLGASYSTAYYKVNGGDGPKTYGVTAGVGLPIMTQFSGRTMLSITAQYEHVEPSTTSIKEDYLRLALGLTFNARWFNKWKVE